MRTFDRIFTRYHSRIYQFKLFIAPISLICGLIAMLPANATAPAELKVFETKKTFAGLDAQFYPLGWTKNGERLAVLIAHPNEAADERLWTLQILDLVNDNIVLNEQIRHIDQGGLTAFWSTHGERVTSLLKPHGILAADFQLKKFPALLGKMRNHSYQIKLDSTYGKEPNFGYRGLTSLKVSLINDAGKSKVVWDKKWPEWSPMTSGAIGYVVNPQGDRIAILLGITKRGYESAPHIRHIQLIGARIGEKF